jgi:hypothetical protein
MYPQTCSIKKPPEITPAAKAYLKTDRVTHRPYQRSLQATSEPG